MPTFQCRPSNEAVRLEPCNGDGNKALYRSAKLPIFSGERISTLEARIKEAHQLVAHISIGTGSKSDNSQPSFTVIHPSFPPSGLNFGKRTYSNCSLSSKMTDQTVSTTVTSGSHSIAGGSLSFDDDDDDDEEEEESNTTRSLVGGGSRSSDLVDAPKSCTESCEWGYFVDATEDEEYRQPKRPQYRRFMTGH